MTLKKITLNAADKQVINALFNRLPKADFGTIKTVREVRRRFELRQAAKHLDKLNEQLGEYGLGPISWDVLTQPLEYADDVRQRIEDNPDRIADLLWQFVTLLSQAGDLEELGVDGLVAAAGDLSAALDHEGQLAIQTDEHVLVHLLLDGIDQLAVGDEHTIDDSYLQLLTKLLEDMDWSKARVPVQANVVREVDVAVPVSQMEAIADLADKIFSAMRPDGKNNTS